MDAILTAVHFIKDAEGFRAEAYLCPAGRWTIGYGSTLIEGQPVRKNEIASEVQAMEYLMASVRQIDRQISGWVHVPLTENQRAALISFVYNVGLGAFCGSSLLKDLNANDYGAAANELIRWVRGNHGEVLPGLVLRRQKEKELFLS